MDAATLKIVIALIEDRIKVLKETKEKTKSQIDIFGLSHRIEEQCLMQIALQQALINMLKFDITVKSN